MSPKGIPYVDYETAERAREFEYRIARLPVEAGILFAGVQATPVPGGESETFTFTVGIDRAFEPGTIEAVLRNVFGKEILDGINVTLNVVRGTVGLAAQRGYKALPGPDPIPS